MTDETLIARLEAATEALSDAADILLVNGFPLVAESYRALVWENRAALRAKAGEG